MAVSPSVSMSATLMLHSWRAEGQGDLAQQAGKVLGDHLQQRGVGRGFGVELQPRGDFDLEVGGVVQVAAGFEQLLD